MDCNSNVESHATGFDLAGVLAAVANPSFPVQTFHWDGAMHVDDVTTWTAGFQTFGIARRDGLDVPGRERGEANCAGKYSDFCAFRL